MCSLKGSAETQYCDPVLHDIWVEIEYNDGLRAMTTISKLANSRVSIHSGFLLTSCIHHRKFHYLHD